MRHFVWLKYFYLHTESIGKCARKRACERARLCMCATLWARACLSVRFIANTTFQLHNRGKANLAEFLGYYGNQKKLVFFFCMKFASLLLLKSYLWSGPLNVLAPVSKASSGVLWRCWVVGEKKRQTDREEREWERQRESETETEMRERERRTQSQPERER